MTQLQCTQVSREAEYEDVVIPYGDKPLPCYLSLSKSAIQIGREPWEKS